MKYLHLFIGFIFLIFAFVQLNDPDPWLWVIFYTYVAAIGILHFLNRSNKWLILFGLAIFAFELMAIFPGFSDWFEDGFPSFLNDEYQNAEIIREGLGLCIGFIVLVFYYILNKAKQKI